jgi:hypothetical protein
MAGIAHLPAPARHVLRRRSKARRPKHGLHGSEGPFPASSRRQRSWHLLCEADRLTLIVAGHETTASTLAWAFQHVHQAPSVRARLVEELRALPEPLDPEAVARLPYLDAVCSETLRLTPVLARRSG